MEASSLRYTHNIWSEFPPQASYKIFSTFFFLFYSFTLSRTLADGYQSTIILRSVQVSSIFFQHNKVLISALNLRLANSPVQFSGLPSAGHRTCKFCAIAFCVIDIFLVQSWVCPGTLSYSLEYDRVVYLTWNEFQPNSKEPLRHLC